MPRTSYVAATLAFAARAMIAPIAAQSIAGVPIEFGVMGGFTKPAGALHSDASHAWNVGGLVSLGAPNFHLSFRLDGQWAQLNGRTLGGGLACPSCSYNTTRTDYRVLNTTANLVFGGALSARTRVYVIGGVGVYNERGTKVDRSASRFSIIESSRQESVTRLGVNGGIGGRCRLASHPAFVEVRSHNLIGRRAINEGTVSGDSPTSFQFVPINVGFTF